MQTPLTNKTKHTACSFFHYTHLKNLVKKSKNKLEIGSNLKKRTKSTMEFTNFEASKVTLKKVKEAGKTILGSTNYTNSCKNKQSMLGISSPLRKLRKKNKDDYYKYKSIARICYDELLFNNDNKSKLGEENEIDNEKQKIIGSIKKLSETPKEFKEMEEESFTSESESESKSSSSSSETETISEKTLSAECKKPTENEGESSEFTSSSSMISNSTLKTRNARGNTESVLSFLVLREGKNRHKNEFKAPRSMAIQKIFSENQRREMVTHFSEEENYILKKHNNNKEELNCQVCRQKVFNGQEVACFSICEHYMHELCLVEMINRKCFKSEKNTSCSPLPLFCPKCSKIN